MHLQYGGHLRLQPSSPRECGRPPAQLTRTSRLHLLNGSMPGPIGIECPAGCCTKPIANNLIYFTTAHQHRSRACIFAVRPQPGALICRIVESRRDKSPGMDAPAPFFTLLAQLPWNPRGGRHAALLLNTSRSDGHTEGPGGAKRTKH
jgi:hypothetical protein